MKQFTKDVVSTKLMRLIRGGPSSQFGLPYSAPESFMMRLRDSYYIDSFSTYWESAFQIILLACNFQRKNCVLIKASTDWAKLISQLSHGQSRHNYWECKNIFLEKVWKCSLNQIRIGQVNGIGFQTWPRSIRAHMNFYMFLQFCSSLDWKEQNLHFGGVKLLVYLWLNYFWSLGQVLIGQLNEIGIKTQPGSIRTHMNFYMFL